MENIEEEKVNKDNENKVNEEIEESENTLHTIKVYFSDDQAENLVEKEIDIKLDKDDNLEEKVIESLKVKPEDENVYNAVEEDIKFNSVKVEDKIAMVDVSSKNLNGGSTQELFFVDSIVSALTYLDSVDGVKFLVDGEDAETLMGHMEVSHVFTKDDVGSNIIK